MVLACTVVSLFTIYTGLSFARKAEGRVYVLANGKAMEAFSGDRKDNVLVEARDHVRVFHQLFFSLDPDEKVIAGNAAKAFYLADGSVKRIYDNLKEAGFYAGIIAGNISQVVTIDSVLVDEDRVPILFTCFGTEKIIRATSVTMRNLVTRGWLRIVTRSDNNPHGFLIERFEILDNKDLFTKNR
jgi:conjugative transposon TraK protein